MIWLSGLGGWVSFRSAPRLLSYTLYSIQPVGHQILSGLNIAGHTWNLWSGPNSNWQVFSFVISSGEVRNFNADLNEFFGKPTLAPSHRAHVSDILLSQNTLSRTKGSRQHRSVCSNVTHDTYQLSDALIFTQFLQAIQTGTEPFVGSASLLTESFSVSVNV